MPVYIYVCDDCKVGGELKRDVDKRDEPVLCPKCLQRTRRAITMPMVNWNGSNTDDEITKFQFKNL